MSKPEFNWSDVLEYMKEHTVPETADAFKCSIKKIRYHMSKAGLTKKMIKAGVYEIDTESSRDIVDPGYFIKGKSTLFDADGNVKIEWVKTDKKKEDLFQLMSDSIGQLIDPIQPLHRIPSPQISSEDLLTNYITTDLHLGLLAWQQESGVDVDSHIVYANTRAAMELLVASSPNSEVAIFSDLGDTLHSSGDDNRTKSGHHLDVDSRHAKIFYMLVELKIAMLELALKKHPKVIYICVAGNHSDMIGIYLKAVLKARFSDNPRLTVEMSPAMHQYHHFGKVLLAYTHSHTGPAQRLPGVMAVDNIEIFSQTRYRYFHCGHYHSARVHDDPLCFIENHRNFTNNDYYSQASGFRTNKEMKSITYHKDYGEWSRNIAPLARVEEYLRSLVEGTK